MSEGKSRGRQGQGTVSKSTVRGEQKVLSRGGTGSLFLKVTGLPWGCGWRSVAALPVCGSPASPASQGMGPSPTLTPPASLPGGLHRGGAISLATGQDSLHLWGSRTTFPHCWLMGTANPCPGLAKGLPALQGPGVTPCSGHPAGLGWLYPASLSLPATL